MTEANAIQAVRTPWHLWVIGVVALLWNAIGAFDYVMTETRNAAYMSAFTPEQLAYFYGFPGWVTAAWAIAVWGGVVGAVLLLLRRRLAVPVFLASLVAMVLTTVHNYVLSNGLDIFQDAGSRAFTCVIFVIALALFLYARAAAKRGVLV
jgi:ribose/xylose/arabinose/galactoside ABC-type transport system permease subunit